MTSRDFAYWLQGFFEISDPKEIGVTETHMIKRHLNLVFKHEIDPSMGGPEHQKNLNEIHHELVPNQTADYSGKLTFPTTEEEAIAKWGPKPSPKHEFNLHGWYDPKEGVPRC